MTPEQFATEGKAWIEAIGAVIDALLIKVGIIAAGAWALYDKFIRDRAIHARLDRQREAIRNVATEASIGRMDALLADDPATPHDP